MKYTLAAFLTAVLLVMTACIQVQMPETEQKKTAHYVLLLPENFKAPALRVSVAEFTTDTSAKFKMLSRKGTEVIQEPFAKWDQSPTILLPAALRTLFNSFDSSYDKAAYLLEGDIRCFERNLDTKTADLNVVYRLTDRKSNQTVFTKTLKTSVPLAGDTPKDFADAMSKAVTEQANALCREFSAVKPAK